MKERPILFTAPMVRAILDGHKTQTRRIVKHPALKDLSYIVNCKDGWWGDEEGSVQALCEFGQVGDQLWVKETSWIAEGASDLGGVMFCADHENLVMGGMKKRPSIFMWRWASRIQLEITGVRVERLQDTSRVDAMAEGLRQISKAGGHVWKFGIPDRDGMPGNDNYGWPWREWEQNPIDAYKKLWESINGAGSWETNPWVWVVEFKRVAP